MKVNIITAGECFNIDSETGNVVHNKDIKWDLAYRVFYIEQDGALKLPENDNYVIDFDPNEVKAGDVLFISHTIKEKAYIILIKDEKFAKFVKTVRELRSKQEEERKKISPCKDCCDSCDNCEQCIC